MITSNKINDYIKELTPDIRGGLQSVKDQALELGIPIIDTQVESYLRFELATRDIDRILEIGTATGYSGSLMLTYAEAAHLDTIEIDQSRVDIATDNFEALGFGDRADILVGDGLEVIQGLENKYDLIFIDGPKSHYQRFLDYSLDLLTDTGIIICDNVLFRGLVAENPAKHKRYKTIIKKMDQFLRQTIEREDLITSLLPVGDGLLLVTKNCG